ncbi:ABC transporter ATP-binding protein [Erysipelotrichaceae bacterium]|nr:ABC transporter ATP-binding protein [Erysipelotrichaceae bacterium]
METKAVLTLANIHKTFHPGTNNENHVLKGINFILEAGEFVTVIGGNGAGKSTLLNTIAGTIFPDEGSIILADCDVTKYNVRKRSKYIGRVFQDPRMGTATRLTIEENLALAVKRNKPKGLGRGVSAKDRLLFEEKLAMLGLNLETKLQAEIGLLSGGQRQAITLLMATLITPKILLLDEHTAALDPKTSAAVLKITEELITSKQLTTLMITHNMEDAIRYGTRLIMLNAGKIVVDVKGVEKQNLTVTALMNLFHQNSGTALQDDTLLLG